MISRSIYKGIVFRSRREYFVLLMHEARSRIIFLWVGSLPGFDVNDYLLDTLGSASIAPLLCFAP